MMLRAGADAGADADATPAPPRAVSAGSGQDVEPQIMQQRKLRKGTRSCWECKRRKVRCSFATQFDSLCIGCQRRGTGCVSQEFPERIALATSSAGDRGYANDRVVRVEALVEQLVKRLCTESNKDDTTINNVSVAVGGEETLNLNGTTPTSSFETESASCLAAHETTGPHQGLKLKRSRVDVVDSATCQIPTPESHFRFGVSKPAFQRDNSHQSVSAALYAALPRREDTQLMIDAGIDVSFHKLITHPFAVLGERPGGGKGILLPMPASTTHPVLLAKHLLIMATCLQFIHPELHAAEISRLSEPPDQLMRRLVDIVAKLVTSDDKFLDSIEGLECVMFESIFEANCGHLRRAWFACRRAMLIAQMMGLHRTGIQQPPKVLDPREPVYPNYFWYRIVCTDRQLCLMLGLPQGSMDISMVSQAALSGDNAFGRFERRQCVIASRILERNESSDPACLEDLVALKEIDTDLQKAGSEMPSKWWLVPNLTCITHDPEKTFWETVRLLEQMLYYNLLNHIHLPYLLRSTTPHTATFDQSKLTCVNASRELLNRFIMFRSLNRAAFSCRAVDFFALTAAMTLVMAHLDEHHKQWQWRRRKQQSETGLPGVGRINVLAHQRNSDRAMMEQVLENMEGVAKLSDDLLSARSACLLKSLLGFETDAVAGRMYDDNFAVATAMKELHPDLASDDGQFLRIDIPYFGTIQIGRDGHVSMEAPQRSSISPPIPQREQAGIDSSSAMSIPKNNDMVTSYPGYSGDIVMPSVRPPSNNGPSLSEQLGGQGHATHQSSSAAPSPVPGTHHAFTPQLPGAINDLLREQYSYPGLTATVDDWAFQGVDMAFFDSLLKGTNADGGSAATAVDDSSSWATWEDLA